MKVMSLLALIFLTINTAKAETLTYGQVHKIAYSAVKDYFSYIDTVEVSDIKNFCPKYNELSAYEKQTFFAHFLTSISFYESSFKKTTTFTENSGVKSKGLIGLSFKATQYPIYQRNGCYIIKTKEDIMEPSKSMRCAMAIIETWMRKDRVLSGEHKKLNGKKSYSGPARYWSTLRSPYQVTLTNYNNRVVTVGKKAKVIAKIKANYGTCF